MLASAAVGAGPTAALAEEGGRVCTVGGVAVPEGEDLPDELPSVVSCFDTAEEAQAFLDAGAPGDVEKLIGATASKARHLTTNETVTIGAAWQGASRTGAELVHWGVGSGCYGVTYGFPSLPAGWNDAIRSSEGYGNCWVSHYHDINYGGGHLICAPYCTTMGAMEGQSSSIVYRPVGTFG